MIFTLLGFMGCGKSTVGYELARGCGWPFHDLDSIIEASEGISISEMFTHYGEQWFRQAEYRHLRTLIEESAGQDCIIALGGGTVTNPLCETLVTRYTFPIYLKCPLEEIVANLKADGVKNRPMFNGYGDIAQRTAQLMDVREPIYERCARVIAHPYSLSSDDFLSGFDIDDSELNG